MKTIEVTVTQPGELHIVDASLQPGMKVQVKPAETNDWTPTADSEHPLWGKQYKFVNPTEPLPEEDWGDLAK